MSLGLLDHTDSTEAFSDSEWRPRDTSKRTTFERSARVPASLSARSWRIPLGQGVLQFEEEPPTRLKSTIEQIAKLCKLQPNWDSYGARSVDPGCAVAAILFLLNAVDAGTPVPTVVPLNRGGIQFEWHCNSIDLEIAFSSPSRLNVSFEDLRTGEVVEQLVSGDWQPVLRFLPKLSQTS